MKVKRLKELLNKFDDETEIMIRNSYNCCGNIADLYQVEKSTYGFIGTDVDCVILNTYHSKKIEVDEDDEIIDYIDGDK